MNTNFKLYFFSLILMGALYVKAQNIEVGYTYAFSTVNENFAAKLYLVNNVSLFEIDDLNPIRETTGEYDSNGTYNIVVETKKQLNRKIVKDFKNDTLLYYNPEKKNKKEYIVVKESLGNFSWQLTNGEEKTILNQVCEKAIGSFRGKDYEVWYAPDLKFTDGPWKFWGLPGLILEVKSTDDTLSITATSLQNNNSEIVINSTVPKTAISWNEYKKVVEMQLKKEKKFLETGFLSSVEGASISAIYKHNEPDLEVVLK